MVCVAVRPLRTLVGMLDPPVDAVSQLPRITGREEGSRHQRELTRRAEWCSLAVYSGTPTPTSRTACPCRLSSRAYCGAEFDVPLPSCAKVSITSAMVRGRVGAAVGECAELPPETHPDFHFSSLATRSSYSEDVATAASSRGRGRERHVRHGYFRFHATTRSEHRVMSTSASTA